MNRLPRLIGISGALGSGKDEVAKMIVELTSEPSRLVIDHKTILRCSTPTYRIKRFAGKLKEIAGVLLNIYPEKFEDREFKESYLPDFDMTARVFLQKFGTDCLRDCLNKDIWVNSLFREFDDNSRWIIPDARFANEFWKIQEMGGICIRVNRPELAGEDLHLSENEWRTLPFDHLITNDKDLPHLRTLVQGMLNTYK